MRKVLPYVCPVIATVILGLLWIDLCVPTPVVVLPTNVEPAEPVVRAIDTEERIKDTAWHDSYVEATISSNGGSLWIDRAEAQKWRAEIDRAARIADLSPGVIAELVGMESGFRNVHNPTSSAFGFGQQLVHNQLMKACRLDRSQPGESIMGAALELRWDLDRFGNMEAALNAYGTITRLSPEMRKKVLARMSQASSRF